MQHFFTAIGPDACKLARASVQLQSPASHGASAGSASLHIAIHEHRFIIHSSRVNVLSTCMEWLVTIVPNVFERVYQQLSGNGFNAIQTLALSLQKDIYEYLSVHLPPAKAQAKFHHMSQWLNDKKADSGFTDEHILRYWCDARGREGSEKFTTVVLDVFQYQEARAQAAHSRALSFSEDADPQAIDERTFVAIETVWAQQIPLDSLSESPKLISKQQAQRLSLLADYPQQSWRFAQTVLRFNVFGGFQGACIQARRNRQLADHHFVLPTANHYAEQTQKFRAQIELNELTFFAVLHILLKQDPDKGKELLAANAHALNRIANAADSLPPSKMLSQAALIAQLLTQPALLEKCKRAYQQNNRQGFTPPTELQDHQLYVDSTLALMQISDTLRKLLEKNRHLFASQDMLKQKYQSDGFIFSSELKQRMME
jgi:hypothetical protein